MKRILSALVFSAAAVATRAQSPATADVVAVLDAWHAAAASADEAKYFSYFTPDAVFLGTDGTERWTRDEFRKWAHPYFARGKAWSFRSTARWISFSPDRSVAWFDEALDTPNLGPCRGSGVLLATPSGWKIAQYNLSIPIPNGLSDEFKKRIEEYAKQNGAKKGS
ncbi:MAG TPA: nuclear transport factor 2 family protein [Thermoanaerobaculia bacterium]|nr:nuclear transport factor 2 family protein [Thermoanaerobaculia bacterium]